MRRGRGEGEVLSPSRVEGRTRWVRTRERERAWARRRVVVLESSSLGGGGNEATGDTATTTALTRRLYLRGRTCGGTRRGRGSVVLTNDL